MKKSKVSNLILLIQSFANLKRFHFYTLVRVCEILNEMKKMKNVKTLYFHCRYSIWNFCDVIIVWNLKKYIKQSISKSTQDSFNKFPDFFCTSI